MNTPMKRNLFEPETWFLFSLVAASRLCPCSPGACTASMFICSEHLFDNKLPRNYLQTKSVQIEMAPLKFELRSLSSVGICGIRAMQRLVTRDGAYHVCNVFSDDWLSRSHSRPHSRIENSLASDSPELKCLTKQLSVHHHLSPSGILANGRCAALSVGYQNALSSNSNEIELYTLHTHRTPGLAAASTCFGSRIISLTQIQFQFIYLLFRIARLRCLKSADRFMDEIHTKGSIAQSLLCNVNVHS